MFRLIDIDCLNKINFIIRDNYETNYRLEIDGITGWCDRNNFFLNVSKTKEMIIDFRWNKSVIEPIIIDNTEVKQIDVFKFLGIHITNDLTWHSNCIELLKKARQRLHFIRVLSSFNVNKDILVNFYSCIIESALTSNILVWYGRATKKDIDLLTTVIKSAVKIVCTKLPSLNELCLKRLAKKTNLILKHNEDPSYDYFELLPNGKRYRHFKGNKRFINSAYPQAVRFLNSKL